MHTIDKGEADSANDINKADPKVRNDAHLEDDDFIHDHDVNNQAQLDMSMQCQCQYNAP